MHTTGHDQVDRLLARLKRDIGNALGDELTGLYVYGSLVTGDFDPVVSDIDLLAVTRSDVDQASFHSLEAMHAGIVRDYPAWDDRVEVAYLSEAGLQTFRTERSQIVVISPGEPLNVQTAGKDWLANWWVVRERGITLIGPPPADVIPPITAREFVECIRDYAATRPAWVASKTTRGPQAYAILTMCRALYVLRNHGRVLVSKREAAAWARTEMPEWAGVINDALEWRDVQWKGAVDGSDTTERTLEFVSYIAGLIGRP